MKPEILVVRQKRSYAFKKNKALPDSFDNNWENNSVDEIHILDNDNKICFTANCQTVANYCFGDNATADTVSWGDTVAPGEFTVRLFVEPRNFHGEIHAIINTIDVDGQKIDRNAMQTTENGYQNGRWLIHDKYSERLGKDTTYAWSAGCFILSSRDLEGFNKKLRELGLKAGDEIRGNVVEI